MTKTKIEWADRVWNPITGCTKVSEGCRNCYAERLAGRFWKDRKFTEVRMHPERLSQPLSWKKPSRVFVNSMSDLFHPDVDHDFIGDVFRVMEKTPQHTYLILTKRPKEMLYWFNLMNAERYLPKVWLGVSVEDQKSAEKRIPLLLKTPAAVRFVSCEPLLGPVDLWKFATREETFGSMFDHRGSYPFYKELGFPSGTVKYHEGIDWVIVGGESGPNARPMHPDWAISIRDQCVDAGVPFFFKQWGEWKPIYAMEGNESNQLYFPPPKRDPDGFGKCKVPNAIIGYDGELKDNWWSVENHVNHKTFKVGKKRAGRLLDGREWNEFPMSETAEVV
jgi:protein gp37